MNAPAWHDPAQLSAARERLRSKQLLRYGDTLSLRLPGAGAFLLGLESPDRIEAAATRLRLSESCASAPAELHRLIYLARTDVGAVLIGRQRWACALPAAGGTLPGVFDEQLRHLGARVTQIEPPQTLAAAHRRLAGGGNAFGLGERVLCLGMTLERVVFNAELLEKCAQAYLLARASALAVRRIPWLVRRIATGRLRRDERRAAGSYARGEAPERVAGY
jgi:ribulose-5-phosphate 4-epimerase/fuculose-1-phosphate aldolase